MRRRGDVGDSPPFSDDSVWMPAGDDELTAGWPDAWTVPMPGGRLPGGVASASGRAALPWVWAVKHDEASADAGVRRDALIVSRRRWCARGDVAGYRSCAESAASRAFSKPVEPAHDAGACNVGWRCDDGYKRRGAHGGVWPYGWAGLDRSDMTGCSCDCNTKARNSGSNSWNPRRYRRHHRLRPRRHPRQPAESCHPIAPASRGDKSIPVP